MTDLDFAPLAAQVTTNDVTHYRKETGRAYRWRSTVLPLLIVGLVVMLIVGASIWTSFSKQGSSALAGALGAWALFAIACLVIWGLVAYLFVSSAYKEKKYVRLWWFARANGLTFIRGKAMPEYPGMIFNVGNDRSSPERLIRASQPTLDLGNYNYTLGSGRNQITKTWGYLAVQLNRKLPHMIVDAKWNNTVGSNLPLKFSRDQALSLEGHFDEFFTLYCPKTYERDALYVFTPDLMARLIDYAPFLDIEIVDDWMFFYSSRPFDLADARTTAQMLWIADSVGAAAQKRTGRYADDRAPTPSTLDHTVNHAHEASQISNRLANNNVAPGARRLNNRVRFLGVFLFVAVIVITVVSLLYTLGVLTLN